MLVQRGSCPFTAKVVNALQWGAAAVIVAMFVQVVLGRIACVAVTVNTSAVEVCADSELAG